MNINYQKLGKRVKEARKTKDIKQEKLAEIAGYSPPHISNIETAQTKVSLQALVNIADVLNIGLDDLLRDTLTPSKEFYSQKFYEVISDCSKKELEVIIAVAKTVKEEFRRDL